MKTTNPAGPTWRTWSGTISCTPGRLARPVDEAGIVEVVRFAGREGLTVRAAGSGHSFNALACTDEVLVDLARCTGVLALDRAAPTVTVLPGTTLAEVSAVLDRAGLALANVGTLAGQTVAGAISTGNHGTGIAHPPFAGQVAALRLVTADGSVRAIDPDTEPTLFRAARTSLGALGIISAVTLRCVPAFNLRVVTRSKPLDALLDGVEEWAASADHVTFSWLPWSDRAGLRSLSVTDQPRTRRGALARYATTLEEVRCGLVGQAGRLRPGAVPWLTDRLGGGGPAEYVDASHRVFSFPQPVKFLAMEHALPLGNVAPALRALRGALRRFGLHSPYSILVRVGAADDAPLSPAYGRRTGYVNLTVPRTAGYIEILRVVEHVLREQDGRPHWGKAHTATAEVLAPRYPRWDEFQRVRAALDPAGMFSNDYIDRVLGRVVQPAGPADERVPVPAGHGG
jgi:FAD-linked oxidoreductase